MGIGFILEISCFKPGAMHPVTTATKRVLHAFGIPVCARKTKSPASRVVVDSVVSRKGVPWPMPVVVSGTGASRLQYHTRAQE